MRRWFGESGRSEDVLARGAREWALEEEREACIKEGDLIGITGTCAESVEKSWFSSAVGAVTPIIK